jgi:hypothetical protein
MIPLIPFRSLKVPEDGKRLIVVLPVIGEIISVQRVAGGVMVDAGEVELKDLPSSEHDRSQNFLGTRVCQSFKDTSEGVFRKFGQRNVVCEQEFHVFVGKEFPEPKQRTRPRERIQNHGQYHPPRTDFHVAIAQPVDTLNEPSPLCVRRIYGQETCIGNLQIGALLRQENLLQKVRQVLSHKARVSRSQSADIIERETRNYVNRTPIAAEREIRKFTEELEAMTTVMAGRVPKFSEQDIRGTVRSTSHVSYNVYAALSRHAWLCWQRSLPSALSLCLMVVA